MQQQLFLQQLAQLPIAPVPYLYRQQCQGLSVILVGEPAASKQAARFLLEQGATVLHIVTDLPKTGEDIPDDVAMLLAAEQQYDALVLVSTAELSLINMFKHYRQKLYLYRAGTAVPAAVYLSLLSDEVSRRVMSQQFYLLQHNWVKIYVN